MLRRVRLEEAQQRLAHQVAAVHAASGGKQSALQARMAELRVLDGVLQIHCAARTEGSLSAADLIAAQDHVDDLRCSVARLVAAERRADGALASARRREHEAGSVVARAMVASEAVEDDFRKWKRLETRAAEDSAEQDALERWCLKGSGNVQVKQ